MAKSPSKNKRVRRTPEEARALIMEATKQLIVERGPDRLGLVAIAERAGVSHSLISHYFGSIDNVLETALTQNIDERRIQIVQLLPMLAEKGPEAFIEHFFALVRDPLFTKLSVWAVLSGRVDAKDFGPSTLESGKTFANALQGHLETQSGKTISRESLEAIITITMCSGVGYALAGEAIWRGLGRERSEEHDRSIRATLARMIEAELGGVP